MYPGPSVARRDTCHLHCATPYPYRTCQLAVTVAPRVLGVFEVRATSYSIGFGSLDFPPPTSKKKTTFTSDLRIRPTNSSSSVQHGACRCVFYLDLCFSCICMFINLLWMFLCISYLGYVGVASSRRQIPWTRSSLVFC